MKKLIALILLSTLFLVGCGIQEVSNDELTQMMLIEEQGTITQIEILSQTLNEKVSDIQFEIVIEDDGIAKQALIDARCIYDEDNKRWDMHYYDTDMKGWNYYPTASYLLSASENQINNIINAGHMIFLNTDEYISYVPQQFKIENIESMSLKLEEKKEVLKFDLSYLGETTTGSTTVTADMKFTEGRWRMLELQYDPMVLNFVEGHEIKPDTELVSTFLANSGFGGQSRILIDTVASSTSIRTENLESIKVIEEVELVSTKQAEGIISVTADYDVATVEVDCKIYYKNQSDGWNIIKIEQIGDPVAVTYKTDFLGQWDGYYIRSNKKRSATLVVTNYLESASVYEGVFSFGSSDTFESETGSYHVLISLDFTNDSYYIAGTEWIDQPSGYGTVDFDIDEVIDNKMIGEPDIFSWSDSVNTIELVKSEE